MIKLSETVPTHPGKPGKPLTSFPCTENEEKIQMIWETLSSAGNVNRFKVRVSVLENVDNLEKPIKKMTKKVKGPGNTWIVLKNDSPPTPERMLLHIYIVQ